MATGGSLLGGRYRLASSLGAGGMGIVYEALDEATGRMVAVKVLRDSAFGMPGALQRFEREARATIAIEHPNVVHVSDVGCEAGTTPYYVMERLRGHSLGVRVRRHGRLDPERVAKIAIQIAAGLQAANEAGILHRDLKPDNVFLCETNGADDRVKVLDFGVAKIAEKTDLTLAGSIVGTLAFMPPEQARGENLDPRADLYSLGACMYFALTGREPFAEHRAHALLAALFKTEPTPLAQLVPEVEPALVAIVERAMKKNRRERFRNPAELRATLTAWLESPRGSSFEPAPVTARLPSTWPPPVSMNAQGSALTPVQAFSTPPPPPRAKAKTPWLPIVSVVTLGLGIAGVAYGWLASRSASETVTAAPPSAPVVVAEKSATSTASAAPTPSATPVASTPVTPLVTASVAPTATMSALQTVPTSPARVPPATPWAKDYGARTALATAANTHDAAGCRRSFEDLVATDGEATALTLFGKTYGRCLMEAGQCQAGREVTAKVATNGAPGQDAFRIVEATEGAAIAYCPSAQWTDAERARDDYRKLKEGMERGDDPQIVASTGDFLLPLIPKMNLPPWTTPTMVKADIQRAYARAGRCADATRLNAGANLEGTSCAPTR
jgi:serine/threonine-protein kinase